MSRPYLPEGAKPTKLTSEPQTAQSGVEEKFEIRAPGAQDAQNSGSEAPEAVGVNILPIPPPLEFPHPSVHNNRAVSCGFPQAGEKAVEEQEATQTPANTIVEPNTPGLLMKSSEPGTRPKAPRRTLLTERPAQYQRPSVLGVRRRQTEVAPDIYNPGLFEPDSESSESSDDESAPNRNFKKSQGVPPNKPKSRWHHPSGRKPSDIPYSKFSVGNEGYKTKGRVSKRDGRLNISLQDIGHRGYLAKALGATLNHRFGDDQHGQVEPLAPQPGTTSSGRALSGSTATPTLPESSEKSLHRPPPKMNIVVMVIGSRGDIQPFLRLGKVLKEDYGHRVRIATHPVFKEFVEKDSGLEFFSVGGDPAELMAFMVKNPGLIPKTETIRSGEIARRRESMYEMFKGFWRACINATDDEKDVENLRMMGLKNPFVADAIIANPPSFAHIHCAERLGVPLHLMFTFPTSPTQQFPHPLANIKKSNVEANYTNFMSYPLVEMMTWQGLGDLINRFRVKTLALEPISTLWAPGQLFRLRVPHTYLWSPDLVPKPSDWGPEINVTGFVFLELASSFTPPDDLAKFLDNGPPPVYIGFGSIVVDDPEKFTSLIFEAVEKAGVRALVSKGWGGLGDEGNTPENVYMLGNTPHDWLFPRVSAVVHHGGAGTTAIGMKFGRPTMIVPFFGDQPFWGAMVAKAGAGAEPIPYKHLTADKLADSIKMLLEPKTQEAAQRLAKKIEQEGDGARNAIESFHRSLPCSGNHSITCSVFRERVAAWWLKATHMRLSPLAAEMLVKQGKIQWKDMRLIRHYEWNDFEGPGEPVTGAGAALATTVGSAVQGIGRTPFRWAKTLKGEGKRNERRKHRQAKETAHDMKSVKPNANSQADDGQNREDDAEASPTSSNRMHDPLTSGMFDGQMAQDLVAETGSGLAKTGVALATAPMDMSLALVRGFHNAPRLYGDSTVRTPRRVQGIKSGLRAAGEEVRFGIYDGWTGLVAQPYHGAKNDGAIGLAKGIGKGFGGWVLKDLAALCGLPAYTMMGIHQELIKSRQPTKIIRRARIFQGQQELTLLSKDELADCDRRIREAWKVIMAMQREIDLARSKGIKGRIQIYKGKRKWKKYGIFESTEQTKRALEAYQAGRSLELDFEPQQPANKEHNSPKDNLVEKDKIEKKKERKSG
ncbi:MAG: hypothetical protein LQ340_004386 [Diploschistes diacapsis]|nr:MAG: hypothetical protein LQ340_004386 [Diploschistes diacapsis]